MPFDFGNFAQSTASGLLSGVGNLLGGDYNMRRQYKYAKKMADYNYQLNEKTANNNDARTRSLMADSDTITKQSMRNAGINTAMNGGQSQVGAVSAPQQGDVSTSAPSLGVSSLGSDIVGSAVSVAQLQKQNEVADSQVDANKAASHKAESDATNQDIKNAFEIDNQIANLTKLHNENKISDAEYQLRLENLKRLQDTHDSFVQQESEKAKQSEIETRITSLREENQRIQNDIANITKDISSEQLKQAKFETDHMSEKFAKEMDVLSSQIRANDASSAASYAAAAESKARKAGLELENKLTAAKVPHAKELAAAYTKQCVNAANLAYEQVRGQKLDNENMKNSRGSWNKNSSIRDKVVYGANTAGDVVRGLLGGIISGSVSKAIK